MSLAQLIEPEENIEFSEIQFDIHLNRSLFTVHYSQPKMALHWLHSNLFITNTNYKQKLTSVQAIVTYVLNSQVL